MSKEKDIIACIQRMIGGAHVSLNDDAYWDDGRRQILSTDMLVEGRHFSLEYFSAFDLGWKSTAVSLSDIAGMGGQPESVLLAIGLPDALSLDWIECFYKGAAAACQQSGARIVGGDTVGSPQLVITSTVTGSLPSGHTLGRRVQAQPGDWIIATGYHGLSALGLLACQAGDSTETAARKAHLRPQPRVEEGLWLSRHYERYALMDSSDGLADALLNMAHASHQTLIVEAVRIPIHAEIQAYAREHQCVPLQPALYGGEDFQLVATVPDILPGLEAFFHILGRVETSGADAPGAFVEQEGKLIPLSFEQTYQHFPQLDIPTVFSNPPRQEDES